MAASPQHHIHRLNAPTLPLRRRRSRLGEPTVVYELVIVDGTTTFGLELHRSQTPRPNRSRHSTPDRTNYLDGNVKRHSISTGGRFRR